MTTISTTISFEPSDSSSLEKVAYVPADNTMSVMFRNTDDGIYQYEGITESMFADFMETERKGQWVYEELVSQITGTKLSV